MRYFRFNCYHLLVILGLLFWLVASGFAAQQVPDFSFIWVSDIHISPHINPTTPLGAASRAEAIDHVSVGKSIYLEPYKLTVPPPSFILATGDLTEYGGAGVTWQDFLSFFRHLHLPLFFQLGNHDNTWVAMNNILRQTYGQVNYAFDLFNCHFIGINSATLQEPLPSIGQEILHMVSEDLQNVSTDTPIFVFLHHPTVPDSFASAYEIDRLFDLLDSHNVVAILAGHSHAVRTRNCRGYDVVEGGSTFGNNAGFNVCSVNKGTFYVTYNFTKDNKTQGVFKKAISRDAPRPLIEISSPEQGATITTGSEKVASGVIPIRCSISGTKKAISRATYLMDEQREGEMKKSGNEFIADLDVKGLNSGAHNLRLSFQTADGETFQRSTFFYLESTNHPKAKWRVFLKASTKSTPLVDNGGLYIGDNAGTFYAYDAQSGQLKWTMETYGEIQASPAIYKDTVYFGSGDNYVYALSVKDGATKWLFNANAPVYSSPVIKDGVVYFGTNGSKLYALDAETGQVKWVFAAFDYSMESTPCVSGNLLYFTAWDGYIYALDKNTGQLKWKQLGPKSSLGRAARYYAGADGIPVVVADKLYICDRGYLLGSFNASDGSGMKQLAEEVAAFSLAADGKALYLRKTQGGLTKIDLQGQLIWNCPEETGRFPVPPVEKHGQVYVCSNTGHLMAIDGKTGRVGWRYQVAPQLKVLSGLAVKEKLIYTAATDGSLTAITLP